MKYLMYLLSAQFRCMLALSIIITLASCSNPTDEDPDGGTTVNPPVPKPYAVKLLEGDISGVITEQPGTQQAQTRPAAFLEYADFYAAAPNDTNQVIVDTSGVSPKLSLNLKLVSKARSQNDMKELFLQRFFLQLENLMVLGEETERLTNGEAVASVFWRDVSVAQGGGAERIIIRPNNPLLQDGAVVEVFAWKVTSKKEIRLRLNAILPLRKEFMLNPGKKTIEKKVTVNTEIRIRY